MRRASVFAKLVAVMLAMAFCITGMVVAFFIHFVNPMVGASVDRMLGDYAQRVARDAPGLEEAHRLSDRLTVDIAYDGPQGAWSTDARLPSIPELLTGRHGYGFTPAWGHSGYLVDAPDGGHYLFAWQFGRRARAAHDRLLLLLLLMMAAVFASAHLVLSRALRPLRALQEGVHRLSAGDLEVEIAHSSRDEFGALTDAFNHMAGRVRAMVQARDQLLIDVSHELRSPLTRLKVALALLPESSKRTQAESDAAEMEAMVTELLEFERLRDPRALRAAPIDLVAVAREMAALHAEGPPGVTVTAAPGAIVAQLDLDGMRTVLRNLLGNAVKYALPDSQPIAIALRLEAAALVLEVRDDGPGIPADDLAHVFEPFFRVDRSRSRRTGGYGLGLSICKRIVEAHGGRIVAANLPGRGACFTLTFPLPA